MLSKNELIKFSIGKFILIYVYFDKYKNKPGVNRIKTLKQ
jgi:hypothetical protein